MNVACWICSKPMVDRPRREGHPPTCSPCTVQHGAGVCSKCGGPKRLATPGICRACGPVRPKVTPGNCKLCGEPYVPRKGARPDQSFCSKSCKTFWQNGARPPFKRRVVTGMALKVARSRARRLRHAESWDGVTDEEIWERDGWRCQIPGCKRRPIRRDAAYPHPRSKSVDHIIPLSLGGDDTAVNKRASHLGCNLARGNQVGFEQTALFGVIREPPLLTMTVGERRAKRKRTCACGGDLVSRKLCRDCAERRQAAVEDRRALRAASPVHYYTCRYCGDLKACKRTAQRREVCPERSCQLARLMANNLRIRRGWTAEDADALMVEQVAAARGPGYGRWQRAG